jgi:tetratricopeptide (TPR) repeat protein
VGPGHFPWRFPACRPERVFLRAEHAHNDYLELLADWGVVGALIVLAGLGCFITGLVETWRHVQRSEADFSSGHSNRFAFFAGASGALAALLVHSAGDYNLHIPANALLAVTWLALLTSNLRFATERYWITVGPRLRWGLTLGLLAVVVVLAGTGQRRVRETIWLTRADRQETNSMSEAYCVQCAAEAEPDNFGTWNRLGEIMRLNSFADPENYVQLGELALQHYHKASTLNPYDPYNYLFSGMTLDWIGRTGESRPFFQRAELCDPNNSFLVAGIGWHFAQIHDFAAALEYSERSRRLNFSSFPSAGESNEQQIRRRLLEEIGSHP